jgi:cytochrome c-type biogenesis protein CcmH/NrfG
MQIKLNPTNGDCWNTLAHILFKKGDIDSSHKAVTMAIEYVRLLPVRKARI